MTSGGGDPGWADVLTYLAPVPNLWRSLAAMAPITVCHEDTGWITADKLAGVAFPASEATVSRTAGDLFARLRDSAGSEAMAGTDVKPWFRLGDPLDGQLQGDSLHASGIVAVGRQPDASAWFAAEEGAGRVAQQYVVGVCGWPEVRDRGGNQALLRALAAEGVTAVVQEQRDLRAIVQLDLRSGRMWPAVLGMARHGLEVASSKPAGPWPPASRLLLHRSELTIGRHSACAAVPAAFGAWLHDVAVPAAAALPEALMLRRPLAARPATDCMRLLDGEGTGWYLDALAGQLVAQRYIDAAANDSPAIARAHRESVAIARALGDQVCASAVWLKLRPRQANTVIDAQLAGLTSYEPIAGSCELPLGESDACEAGLLFRVRPGLGLANGLYLDQRTNRALVRQLAADRRVLNTFCYTGGFTVAAAAGGARRTVSIDAAAPALADARHNLNTNGFVDQQRHDLIRGDVLPWLAKLARRGDRFDLVVLDPPSYATVKNRRWSAAQDYPALVAAALQVLDPGGRVLACVNHAQVDAQRLHQMVTAGARSVGVALQEVVHQPSQLDFPAGRAKAVLVTRQ